MPLGGAVLFLAAIWCTVYLVHYISTRSTATLLPTNFGRTTPSRTFTNVSLRNLQLRYSTSKWNEHHDRLSSLLARKSMKRLNSALKNIYNVGSFLSAFGMIMAVGGLLWITVNSGWKLFQNLSAHDISQPTSSLVKRTLATGTVSSISTPKSSGFAPIIPGVTVPLGHLPVIVIAVFLSQVVHELGHAIAGARELLSMTSAGLSFAICIPSAFVSFPAAGLNSLAARARCRVISAGPFHNLVFWLVLLLISRIAPMRLTSLFSGYKNVSDIGKVVMDVNNDSALSLYLRPGSIITRLDDVALAGYMVKRDVWTEYLTGSVEPSTMGWCVQKTDLEKSNACCSDAAQKNTFPLSCFVSRKPFMKGCIDPSPVLTRPYGYGRCETVEDCGREFFCTFPEPADRLMRITVQFPDLNSQSETIILWSGPRDEIYQEIQVGDWMPRVWFLPLKLPFLADLFWQYLKMSTLSLFFFNLLPLPYLDGEMLLRSFLDILFLRQDNITFDVDELELGGISRYTRIHRKLTDGVVTLILRMSTCLMIACIFFFLLDILLQL